MQRKTPVLKFLFNKVTVQQLSCEYCRVFMKSFFHKTPVAASEKFIKFLEKKKKTDGAAIESVLRIKSLKYVT